MVQSSLHVVLHQPEIPQNTGNIGRTCVAVGAKLWLVRPLGFSLDDRHLRRAGLDYWQYLDFEVVDNWSLLGERLAVREAWFLSKRGHDLYTRATFRTGTILVFGAETQGLPDAILNEHPSRVLRIPTRPEARSLNLANSVAVVTFEAMRQIGFSGSDAKD